MGDIETDDIHDRHPGCHRRSFDSIHFLNAQNRPECRGELAAGCCPFRANRLIAIFPGRCPGLSYFAPLGRDPSRFGPTGSIANKVPLER
jgi:hypothetical protein